MSKYNDQYYLVFRKPVLDKHTLYLAALQKSEDRDYGFEELDPGDEPLFFENAFKEKDQKLGVKRHIAAANMNMVYVLVNDELREEMKHFEIDYFQLYPSVIIDDEGEYHENFWLLHVYEKLDCLDFDRCVIDDYDPEARKHDVDKYYLSDSALSAIPEERRLIFRPEKAHMGYTFVHQKIVDIFNSQGVDSLRFIKVSDWEMGMQFES
jgi:hypothetical protein